MQTISIKGHEYVTVNERVKEFRAQFPNWSIQTKIIHFEDGCVIIKALVLDENEKIKATGIAQEYRDNKASLVNATSFVENCETSAVGRCLGILGIGIDTSIASADEVSHAIEQQEKMEENQLLKQALKLTEADDVLTFYKQHQAEIDADEAIKVQIISYGKELRKKEVI